MDAEDTQPQLTFLALVPWPRSSIFVVLVLKDFKRELLVFHLVLYARVIGSSFGVYKQELLGVRSEFVNESYWYLF